MSDAPAPVSPAPHSGRGGGACPCARCRARGLIAPVMILTVGVLFLAPNFLPRFHFRDLWPVILIVLGLLKLLESTASTEGHRG